MTFGGLPSVDIEIVQQAGHSVYFERPATFNDLIRTFLAGTD
jgi:pimeloyl-ACP methyl ester carboxylesterase